MAIKIPPKKDFPLALRWIVQGLLTPLVGIVLLMTWIRLVEAGTYPEFILPHPKDVVDRLQILHERGILMRHVWATTQAAAIGLAYAVAFALPVGYLVARVRFISALLMPYLVAVRAIPVVAIAAMIVIWLGTGLQSKVFVAAFITWFPLMEAVILGIQSVDPRLRDLMRGYEASWFTVVTKLEIPATLPNLLSGLKIASTLAVVGAAVGELVGSNQGLAYLIVFGRGTSDAPLVFGAVLLLTCLSLSAYCLVAILESVLLAWRRTH